MAKRRVILICWLSYLS